MPLVSPLLLFRELQKTDFDTDQPSYLKPIIDGTSGFGGNKVCLEAVAEVYAATLLGSHYLLTLDLSGLTTCACNVTSTVHSFLKLKKTVK